MTTWQIQRLREQLARAKALGDRAAVAILETRIRSLVRSALAA